jgi:hypothetical protein
MNSNSSAGGGSAGGSRILSSIGINLSPRTREVAGDQIRCQRAVDFYNFLRQLSFFNQRFSFLLHIYFLILHITTAVTDIT